MEKIDDLPCAAEEKIDIPLCETTSSPINETPLLSVNESVNEINVPAECRDMSAKIDTVAAKPQSMKHATETPSVSTKLIETQPSSNWRSTTPTKPQKFHFFYTRKQLWDKSTLRIPLNPALHKLLIDRELFQVYNEKAIQCQRAEQLARKPPKSAIVHVSLSLNEDVKLNECENAWRPSHITKSSSQDSSSATAEKQTHELYRKVRGILNRLTPEYFEKLVEQIQCLNIDTSERLQGVILLVFEKAIDEQMYAVGYASLCNKLSQLRVDDDGGKDNIPNEQAKNTFVRKIIVKCQSEFYDHVIDRQKFEEKLEKYRRPYVSCPASDVDRKAALLASLEEEERRLRRRSVGTCRFVGELYKTDLLKQRVMHECIKYLLKQGGPEEYLECLCTLLTTIGAKMDEENANLKSTFDWMNDSIRRSKKLSNRVKFMMQDVIDLRDRKWALRTGAMESVPKTMVACEREMKIKAAAAMLARPPPPTMSTAQQRKNVQQQQQTRSHNGGRYDYDRQPSNSQSMTFSRSSQPVLAISNMRQGYAGGSDTVLGYRGQFSWPQQQQKPPPTKMLPPSPPLKTISVQTKPNVSYAVRVAPKQIETDINVPDEVLTKIQNTMRLLMEVPTKGKRYETIEEMPSQFKWACVRELFNVCVETVPITTDDRFRAGNKCSEWLKTSKITFEHFMFGLTDFFTYVEDLIIDIPKILTYIVELMCPILRDGNLNLNHLRDAAKSVCESSLADRFVNTLTKFLTENLDDKTVQDLYAGQSWIKMQQADDRAKIMSHIDKYFEQNTDINTVNAYISKNVLSIDALFVRELTTSIVRSAMPVSVDENSNDNSNDVFKERVTDGKHCRIEMNEKKLDAHLVLLKRLVANRSTLAIECLYAVQLFSHALEHPPGLLADVMHKLYNDVVPNDVFLQWEKSILVPEGKGVCIKSLKSLFDMLHQSDDEG